MKETPFFLLVLVRLLPRNIRKEKTDSKHIAIRKSIAYLTWYNFIMGSHIHKFNVESSSLCSDMLITLLFRSLKPYIYTRIQQKRKQLDLSFFLVWQKSKVEYTIARTGIYIKLNEREKYVLEAIEWNDCSHRSFFLGEWGEWWN